MAPAAPISTPSIERSAVGMPHHNPKILDIRLIGTESEPHIEIQYVDGTVHTWDASHFQRFVSDTIDWALLMDDLLVDRQERGAEAP
jgi:hypothetical protein